MWTLSWTPEEAWIIWIILLIVPAVLIDGISFGLRRMGGLPARQWRLSVSVLAHLLLYFLFLGGFTVYWKLLWSDLLWREVEPYRVEAIANHSGFLDAVWWLTLAWWSALVGASILWKADMQRTWLRRGIVALTIAYPVLQVAYAVPIFIRQSGLEPSPAKPIWNIVQAALAIAFWIILLVLLLRHRYQVEKEIKTARAALFHQYNKEQPR